MDNLVSLTFNKIMQTRSYTVLILASTAKRFAIYTEPSTGKFLQLHLGETKKTRPMTHDLIQMILTSLEAQLTHVIIYDFHENIYYVKIYLISKLGDEITRHVEIDARPSDAIALALLYKVPLYCTQSVLENTLAVDEE